VRRAPSKSRYAPNVPVCLPPEPYLPTWITAMWRWLVMWARTNRTNHDFDGALDQTRGEPRDKLEWSSYPHVGCGKARDLL